MTELRPFAPFTARICDARLRDKGEKQGYLGGGLIEASRCREACSRTLVPQPITT
jgi:hypothetical protein